MNLLDSWIEKIALLTQYKTGKIRLIDYIKLLSFASYYEFKIRFDIYRWGKNRKYLKLVILFFLFFFQFLCT